MKKASRILACLMLAAAIGFVAYAIGNPQASWPWSNSVTYSLYGLYLAVTVFLFIAPFKGSGK